MTELSIIIPCYNYAQYLSASVDSVLKQKYSNYEIILIDDGSTDKSWEIMQDYADKFRCVRAFKNEKNQGIFKANKKGWDEAKGQYLHFFSADDVYHPSYLSKTMQFFHENSHLGLICTDIAYFHDHSPELKINKLLSGYKSARIFMKNEMIPLFQSTYFWVPGLTCIVKREILEKYGHLDPKLENISDWFCFHKIALYEGIGYIPEALISMRLHDKTYTSIVKNDKIRRRATYTYLLKLLSQNKDIQEQFKQAGLLSFIFKELYWKLRFHPKYFSFWRYIKL